MSAEHCCYSSKTLDNIQITIPSDGTAIRFEVMVTPIMEQIKAKMQENMLLTESRDRLLSKQMSREIEVE